MFCLPHAGGNSYSFTSWAERLPAHVELTSIDYSGHGRRYNTPLLSSIESTLDDLLPIISSRKHKNFALFGHSLGGLVSYELCKRLKQLQQKLPSYLCLSASAPPPFVGKTRTGGLKNIDELVSYLRKQGGTPEEILSCDEILETMLKTFNADLQILSSLKRPEIDALGIPINIFCGQNDPVTKMQDIEKWRKFEKEVSITYFSGSHFYLREHEEQVVSAIISQATIQAYA